MITIRSIVVNFRYLSFSQAIRLPILVSRNVVLKRLSGKIILAKEIKTGDIQIGYGNLGIFDKVLSRSILDISGTIIFKGKAKIGHGSKISIGKNGTLELGNDFKISAETKIIVHKKVIFGDNCLLSWDITMMDTDFHNIRNKDNRVINYPREIKIGANVWIGCGTLILKGSVIPNNSIIAANTTVSGELIGEGNVFGGNPIKAIKSNVIWEHESDS